MDKKQLIGAVVGIFVIVLFLAEQFYFGTNGAVAPGLGGTNGGNVSGTALFNGSIRTYDPILLLPTNTSPAIITALQNRSDVRSVQNTSQGIVVNTQTRDDVYPIDTYLRSVNVTAYSVANIAATDTIPLDTPLGTINTTVETGVLRVVTEPIVDSGTPVTISLVAIESDGIIIDVTSANILTQSVNILMDSSVSNLDHVTYSYSIPWENRSSLGNLSQYGQYSYNEVDSIVFQSPINISQVLEKKPFPFVVYIDTHSAQVDPSFNNLTQVAQDFQDTPFVLPSSTLNIISTTNVTPNIPFTPAVSYAYNLTLFENESNYTLPVSSFLVDTNYQLPINSSVKLNISAVSMGNRVVAINGVSLPS